MPLFDRLLEVVTSFGGLIFGLPGYKLFKLIFSILGLFFSLALIGYWLYLESKFKWGRWWWKLLFNIWAEAKVKPKIFQKEWKKLENVFKKDKIASLIRAEEILQAVLNLYFFKEKELLKDRLEKTSKITIPNIERLKMANSAIELIKTNRDKGKNIDVSETEILSILKEFEQALLGMLVITEEDLWVAKPEQPQLQESFPAAKS